VDPPKSWCHVLGGVTGRGPARGCGALVAPARDARSTPTHEARRERVIGTGSTSARQRFTSAVRRRASASAVRRRASASAAHPNSREQTDLIAVVLAQQRSVTR